MSATVEERVGRFSTELTFKNDGFEQKVEQSLGTLRKLKEALNFKGCEASFDEVSKAADNFHLDKISSGIDQLTRRFSLLGIVGMTNIVDLTRAIRGKLLGAVNTVTGKIVEGGKRRAMNVEQARFLLQGLIDSSSEIEEIMKNAKDSVTDTAYGYDQAAMAAAQFATSGVKGGEQMLKALSGVAGVAATTNSEYSSISEIFTQVAGKGRLMGDELLQLSSRGLNAAAIIAKYFNNVQNGSVEATDSVKKSIKELSKGLEVSEGDIRDWTSKGKINFDIFSNAMSETFGAHAKDANKTLTGVLSNVNARFSQIGEKFVTPLIQQEGPLVSFFNTIKDKLAEVRDNVDPLARLFDNVVIKGLSEFESRIKNIPVKQFMDNITQGVIALSNGLSPGSVITKDIIEGLGLSENQLSALGKTIRAVARDHGVAINDMIAADGKFLDTLKHGWLTFDIFKEAIDRTFGKEETKETVKNINEIREAALATIRGDYGDGAERITKLTEAGFDAKVVQDYVDKIHEAAGGTWNFTEAMLDAIDAETGSAEALTKLTDKQLKSKGYTDEQIQGFRELAKVAKETGTPLNELLEKAKDPFYGVKLILETASNLLSNFGKIAGVAKDAFKEVFPPVLSVQITGFLVKLNNLSKSLMMSDETADKFRRTFRGLFSVVRLVLDFAIAKIGTFGPIIIKVASSFLDLVLGITAKIGDFVFELTNAVREGELFNKVFSIVGFLLNTIVGAGGKVISVISGIVSGIVNFIGKQNILTKIIGFLSDKLGKLSEFLNGIQKAASVGVKMPGIESLVKALSALKEVVSDKLFGPALEKITNFFSGRKINLPNTSGLVSSLQKIVNLVATGLAKAITTISTKLSKFDFNKAFTSISAFIDKVKVNYGIPIVDKLVHLFDVIKSHLPSVESVTSSLQNLFSFIGNNIALPAFDAIVTFVTTLVENGPSIESATTFLKSLFDVIASNFKMPGFENFIDIMTKLKGLAPDIESVTTNTTNLAAAASGKFDFAGLENFKEAVENIKKQFIDPWVDKVNNFIKNLQDAYNLPGPEKIKIVFEEIGKAIKNLDPDTVYMWLSRIQGLLMMMAATKAIKAIASSFAGVADAFKGIGESFKGIATAFTNIGTSLSGGITMISTSISDVFKQIKTNLKVGMILKIAVAVGILAGAMWVLSKIPSDKWNQVFDLFAELSACLAGMYLVIGFVNSKFGGDVSGAASAVVGFAAAIWVMANAMHKLKDFTSDDLINAGTVIGFLTVVLGIAIQAFRGLETNIPDLFGPISFAIAVDLLVIAVAAIGKIPKAALDQGISRTIAVMVGLAAALRLTHIFSSFHFGFGDVVAPLTFVAAIFILAIDILAIGAIPQALFDRSIERMNGIIVFFEIALLFLRIVPTNIANALVPLTLTTALFILALDIVALGLIPEELIKAGGARAALCLLALGGAAGIMNHISGDAKMALANSLVPVSLARAVLILALAIALIGIVAKYGDVATGFLIAMGTLVFVSQLSAGYAQMMKDAKVSPMAIANLVAFTIAVGLLALEIALLGKIVTIDEAIAGGLVAIAAAGALGIMADMFSRIKLSAAMIIAPIEFVIVLGVLMLELAWLGWIPENVVSKGIALAMGAVLSLVLLAMAFDKFGNISPKSLLVPIALIATMFVMIEMLRELGAMDPAEFNQGLSGIVAIMAGLALAIYGLTLLAPNLQQLVSTFKQFAVGAIGLAAAFAIVSGGMILLAVALTTMANVPVDTVNSAMFTMVALLIALAVGANLIKGLIPELAALSFAFVMVCGSMILFAGAMTLLENINWQVILAAAMGLALCIFALGVAASAGAVPLLAAGAAVLMLGLAAVLVGAAFVVASVGAAAMAAAIQSISNTDPWTIAAFLFGMAAAIVALGVAAAIGGIPILAVGAAFLFAGAGALMAAAAFSIFVGAMPAFLEQLNSMAQGFTEFGGNIVAGIRDGILAALPEPVKAIGATAVSIADKFKQLLGINSPSAVMSALSMFIPAGVGQGILTGSPMATGAMSDMSTNMLDVFNTNMFGEGGIGSSGSQISALLAGQINAGAPEANTAAGELADTTNNSLLDGITNFDYSSVSSFIPGEIGAGITNNTGDATAGIDEMTSQMMEQFGINLEDYDISSMTADIPSLAGQGITDNQDIFSSSALDMLTNGNTDMSNWISSGSLSSTGGEFDSELAKGVKSKSGKVEEAAREASKDGARAAERTDSRWYDAGRDVVEGLARGIRSGSSRAINAAVDVATAAYRAAKSALAINSPSKLFAKLGEGIDEGFVKGMRDKENQVTGQSEQLVKGMLESSRSVIDDLADLLNGDFIDDPTITPVLDLSEIQNDANKLYSMMNEADRLTFHGDVDLANNTSRAVTAEQRRQQESNDQMMNALINAINGLSALIGNTGNVYNVNGVTYDDGSNVSSAVRSLIRAAKIEGRA